ncbi:alpha/beta-hydrolase [Conidiobolus coronatus NRRL 28638]|uniref:Alpha/beta-hydrolase n=1 Tax=Conidiobolus coronatus (strain ATCC 28846 / CBS 209.66 / NRRL 28638) TaxID=796925 RepID=A0A137PA14_CONC2|nr:alpha/beta-hydrolase [Conidiobolus coronatus NRRL 28638]|eukprot:KXN71804.1 alpha/beta-hydrolase [Conidiobolus coronatus NRRL 28638]
MNLILLCLNLLPALAVYNNNTLEELVIPETERSLSTSLETKPQPKLFFDDLLEIPPTFIKDLISLSKSTPPVRLNKATTVQIPSIFDVKRHLNSAITSDCVFQHLANWQCSLFCTDYDVEEVFRNLYYGTLAVVGANHKTKEIIISHRGSINIQNWLRNLSYEPVQFPGAKEGALVHKGFLGVYNSNAAKVNEYLFKMIEKPKYKGYTVIFTGHSLGAAAATVQAVDLGPKLNEKKVPFKLFAYHSPRVGDKNFVDYAVALNFPIARYTMQGDLVNQLGPRQLKYVHLPGEFHTHKDERGDKVMTCSQEWDEDPNCAWSSRDNIDLLDHVRAFNQLINFLC